MRILFAELLTKHNDYNHKKTVKEETKADLRTTFLKLKEDGQYLDVHTLSSWFCFSGRRR